MRRASSIGLLPLLLLLSSACGRTVQPTDPASHGPEPQRVTLPKEATDALARELLSGFGEEIKERVRKAFCAEFEIQDSAERQLLDLPGPGFGSDTHWLARCVVKPSARVEPPYLYKKQLDEHLLWYARVPAPASSPLALLVARSKDGSYRLVQEVVYDGKGVKRKGALKAERQEVREAVGEALAKIAPEVATAAAEP